MTRWIVAAAALVALACSAPAEPTADAARETLLAYLEASRVEDWDAVYALVAPESLGEQTREAFVAERRRSASPLGRVIQERTEIRIGAVELEDDRARVQLQLRMPELSGLFTPGGRPGPEAVAQAPLRDAEQTMELVWLAGGWRVVRPRPVQPAPADLERLRERLEQETDRVVEDLVRREAEQP